QPSQAPSVGGKDWDKWYERLLVYVPWLLLTPAAVISQLPPDQSARNRLITLGLVAVAAGWVYVWHTRATAERRERTLPMVVYFAGLLLLFGALMSRDLIFVLFTITGFFHAYNLKPWPLGVAGVFGTSVVLNTMAMGFPDGSAQEVGTYVGVIAVQTAAIGAGIVFSEKAMKREQQREQMLQRLEQAL